MTISATNLGTGSGSSVTSVTVTANADCAVGDLVIVTVGDDTGASSSTGSVSDTQSNTYNLLTSVALVSSTGTTQLFWSVLTTALTGSTDTIKFTSSDVSGHQIAVSIVRATSTTGWLASPVDTGVTHTATASTSTATVTAAGAVSKTGELWFTAVNATAPSVPPSITNSGSWAAPPNSVSGGSTTAGGGSQVGTTGTPSYSASLSASVRWGAIIAAFIPAVATVVLKSFDPGSILAAWQQDTATLQAYQPRLRSPGIPGMSVDLPPFQHPERAIATGGADVAGRQWQPEPWPPNFLGGRQPYDQSRLNPSITAVPVNNPPFGIPPPAQPTWLDQWKPDPWPPVFMGSDEAYAPLAMSPEIPGQSVDRPPFRHPERTEISVQLKQAWQPDLWPVEFTGGRQPYDAARLPPAITAVPVNNPPMGHYERWLVQQQINAAQLAQPDPWAGTFQGGAQAYAPFKMNGALMGITVSNPPFADPERNTGLANIKVAVAWQPDPWPPVFAGGRQPYDQQRLPVQITAGVVNNPPFGIPPPWVPSVLVTWQPDPWPPAYIGGKQAYDGARLSPGIPGQSVDPPPVGIHPERVIGLAAIKAAWQPDPWPSAFVGGAQPYASKMIPPGAPGVAVSNPPFQMDEFGDQAESIKVQWQPASWPYTFIGAGQPYEPPLLVSTAGIAVNNPPFGNRGRTPEQVAATVGQWQPDPWPPVSLGGRQAYAPKQLTPPSIDRPSVLHPERSPVTASIKVAWQPDPWPSVLIGGSAPYVPRPSGAGIPGRSVDRPPVVHQGKRIINVAAVTQAWQPELWPYVFTGGAGPYTQATLSPGVARLLPSSPLGQPIGQFIFYYLSSAPGQLFPAYISAMDPTTSAVSLWYFPPNNLPLFVTGTFYDPLRQTPSSWSYQDPQDRFLETVPSVGQIVLFFDGTSTYPAMITAFDADGNASVTAFPPGGTPVLFDEVNFDPTGLSFESWRYPSTETEFVETTGPHRGQIVAFITGVGVGYPAMITAVNKDGTVSLIGFGPGQLVPALSVPYSSRDTAPNAWQYRPRRN